MINFLKQYTNFTIFSIVFLLVVEIFVFSSYFLHGGATQYQGDLTPKDTYGIQNLSSSISMWQEQDGGKKNLLGTTMIIPQFLYVAIDSVFGNSQMIVLFLLINLGIFYFIKILQYLIPEMDIGSAILLSIGLFFSHFSHARWSPSLDFFVSSFTLVFPIVYFLYIRYNIWLITAISILNFVTYQNLTNYLYQIAVIGVFALILSQGNHISNKLKKFAIYATVISTILGFMYVGSVSDFKASVNSTGVAQHNKEMINYKKIGFPMYTSLFGRDMGRYHAQIQDPKTGTIDHFYTQLYQSPYFLLLEVFPLCILLILLLSRASRYRKGSVYLLGIYLGGVALFNSFQIFGLDTLFFHSPFFSVFRDPYKIVQFIYLFLIIAILGICPRRYIKLTTVLLCISLIYYGLFNGDFFQKEFFVKTPTVYTQIEKDCMQNTSIVLPIGKLDDLYVHFINTTWGYNGYDPILQTRCRVFSNNGLYAPGKIGEIWKDIDDNIKIQDFIKSKDILGSLGIDQIILHKDISFFEKNISQRMNESRQLIDFLLGEKKIYLSEDNKYFSIYKFIIKRSQIFVNSNQATFQKINPTQYHLTTTLKSKQDLKFLQSYHPEWKLYLEPYAPLDCGSGAMMYSGTVSGESGIGTKPLLVSSSGITRRLEVADSKPYQGRDGTTDTTSTGIYLSQRGDTLASIARSQTGMTLTGIMALNPGITREVLRRGTEIVISISEQNPPSPLSQGGTGTTEQTGTGESYHVTECPSTNTFYAGGELAKLWQEPIFDDTHQMVYDYANQWTIDPEYIRANYPKSYYRENPDGTIDVRMTMYFRPQSYFYLGLIISGLTLLGCVSYLVVSGVRARRRRGEHRDKKVDL